MTQSTAHQADIQAIPAEVSIALYRTLYLTRRCEEMIVKIYPDDEMKTPMHMSMGQEAVSVGVCKAIGQDGDVLASYRSHATYLAKTENSDAFFGELHGRVNGTANGKGGSMHLADVENGMLGSTGIVAAGIPVALGAAYANKHKQNGRVVATFFGDGATDEAAFWESLNIACSMKLPVLFVCEDNDLAVHTRKAERQGFASLSEVVRQYECLVYEDDTNDVESIYALTRAAINRVLAEDKPAFLNIRTYRYLEPCGTAMDTDAPYRSIEEDTFWKKQDCVRIQRERLLSSGIERDAISELETTIDSSIEASVTAAKSAAHPSPEMLYDGVFHEKG